MTNPIQMIVAGEPILLFAARAMFIPRLNALVIADAHWGKSATFRAASIPLPEGDLADDLARLSGVLNITQAKHLWILGDLLHSKRGLDETTITTVSAWRPTHPALDVLLVRGNHDHSAGDPPPDWGVRVVNAAYFAPPFALVHQPAAVPDHYALAGHLHPAALLMGKGKQRIKLPCFWFGKSIGVLPAFSAFTDGGIIAPNAGDQVAAIADDEIFMV